MSSGSRGFRLRMLAFSVASKKHAVRGGEFSGNTLSFHRAVFGVAVSTASHLVSEERPMKIPQAKLLTSSLASAVAMFWCGNQRACWPPQGIGGGPVWRRSWGDWGKWKTLVVSSLDFPSLKAMTPCSWATREGWSGRGGVHSDTAGSEGGHQGGSPPHWWLVLWSVLQVGVGLEGVVDWGLEGVLKVLGVGGFCGWEDRAWP